MWQDHRYVSEHSTDLLQPILLCPLEKTNKEEGGVSRVRQAGTEHATEKLLDEMRGIAEEDECHPRLPCVC